MRHFLASLCLSALSLSAASAETLGTIEATWDGADRTWFITSGNGESQSSVDTTAGVMDSVTLWGNPAETDLAATRDVVELSFVTMRGPTGKIATSGEMRYLLNAYQDFWDASEEGRTEVTLTAYDRSDTALHLAGTFEAKADHAGESRDVSGRFDVTFPLE
ncbi:hypothetical protein [Tropicimonas sp. IMCC34043]|uniref:hypothetical protein n=1 Tax=Tropicimonas sp. IMCC34043 TaxID=2248760 RepID=UPI000E24F507|nr:hypothetical protein [Tropicimonas sp. IMCC34043]